MAEMSSFSWDEDAQRVVSMDDSDDDSDSPSSEITSKPLEAWKSVDNDEVDKAQTAYTSDLSTLFNFAPRNGNGPGSGYDPPQPKTILPPISASHVVSTPVLLQVQVLNPSARFSRLPFSVLFQSL